MEIVMKIEEVTLPNGKIQKVIRAIRVTELEPVPEPPLVTKALSPLTRLWKKLTGK
jgi:hypothetical protein